MVGCTLIIGLEFDIFSTRTITVDVLEGTLLSVLASFFLAVVGTFECQD